MEYCSGSLEDQIKMAERMKQPLLISVVRHYAKQMFLGLAEMHAKDICHRDLKPENILIKRSDSDTSFDPHQTQVKIADFGGAKVLKANGHNTPYIVSRFYRAPELIMGTRLYDCSIDIWSAGCILFELITRTALFPGEAEGLQILEQALIKGMPQVHEMKQLEKIINPTVLSLFKLNQNLGALNLTEIMMSNSRSRYARSDLEKAADLIEKCLKWVPSDRIKAKDALNHPFFKLSE